MSLYRDMQLHVNHDQLMTYPRAVSGSQNVVPFSLDFHKWLFWFMPTEVMYMYIWIIAYYRETQTPQTKSLAVLAYTHCFHTKGACMHSIQATWLCRAVTLSPLWPCASCHLWKAKSNSNIICMTFHYSCMTYMYAIQRQHTLVWNSMLAEYPLCLHVMGLSPPNSNHGMVSIDLISLRTRIVLHM